MGAVRVAKRVAPVTRQIALTTDVLRTSTQYINYDQSYKFDLFIQSMVYIL